MKFKVSTIALLLLACLSGCATQFTTKEEDYVVIKARNSVTAKPTIILAHGCDGVNGTGYKRRANDLAMTGMFNVVMYDSFVPRGYKTVCGDQGQNPVPPYKRVEDIKQIARWIKQQPWHNGGISYVGFSHGGSTGLVLANDSDAQKYVASVVVYYPNCHGYWIGASINNPKVPTMVHLGEKDTLIANHECLAYKDKPNYDMYVYKGATHAFDAGMNIMSLGRHPIVYDRSSTELAEQRSREFFQRTLK